MHSRNRHKNGYNFTKLTACCPALSGFVKRNPSGRQTIDFSDPIGVKMLNMALLMLHYKINHWDIPAGYLCPPIPGRADYIHHLADLLGQTASLQGKEKNHRLRHWYWGKFNLSDYWQPAIWLAIYRQ